MNQLYFIGAGPGDPQLLTLQGANALAMATTVYVPTPYDQTFAEPLQGKTVLIPFDYDYAELIEMIEQQLQEVSVAFLIPGDLTFYSPFQGLIDHFAERSVVLAGVGVANAASARLKKTLDLPSVTNRAMIVSPKTLGDSADNPTLEQLAAPGVSLLIYMNNLPLEELVAKLRQGYGKDVPIALLHCLGLPGEAVIEGTLDTIVANCGGHDYFFLNEPSKKPALTLVIVGETLQETVDGSWWDYRRETMWKQRKVAEGR
ncbi:MAG TPA: SAM-dependent methyltransferase [Malonomonas sp.]